jgi:hypothetical protein
MRSVATHHQYRSPNMCGLDSMKNFPIHGAWQNYNGAHFIPSLGVLNDNEGSPDSFVPPGTLRRNLHIARDAGVAEIWIFGVNGLNDAYLDAIHEALPLEILPAHEPAN